MNNYDYVNDWNKEDYIAIFWHVDDVLDACENEDFKITKEQARDVLRWVDKNHDCNFGITWETLQCAARDVIRGI